MVIFKVATIDTTIFKNKDAAAVCLVVYDTPLENTIWELQSTKTFLSTHHEIPFENGVIDCLGSLAVWLAISPLTEINNVPERGPAFSVGSASLNGSSKISTIFFYNEPVLAFRPALYEMSLKIVTILVVGLAESVWQTF